MELIRYIFELIHRVESFFQITSTGYFEHLIAGILIGGLVSFVMLKRTNQKYLSLFIALIVVVFIGLSKELIDPYIRGSRDKMDLAVTALGGLLGYFIVLTKWNTPKMAFKNRLF